MTHESQNAPHRSPEWVKIIKAAQVEVDRPPVGRSIYELECVQDGCHKIETVKVLSLASAQRWRMMMNIFGILVAVTGAALTVVGLIDTKLMFIGSIPVLGFGFYLLRRARRYTGIATGRGTDEDHLIFSWNI
jgi:hypothetical protein